MKFGASSPDFTLVRTRWGTRHAVKQGDGRFVHCSGNPALCKFCHEHGVPVDTPDPVNAMIDALRANWGKRWFESNRHPGRIGENEIWPADGLHIVAQEDDSHDRTILVSFGDDPAAMVAIGALVHVHNEMIGKAD